jgi:excisionase family DNA binding protein
MLVGMGNPEEDTYTTGQAARILKVTDRGVRKMIDRGELEASADGRGRHRIPQRAVHAMLEERRRVTPSEALGAGEISAEEAAHAADEARDLRERVQDLMRQLGRVEGRLELTERTESTMREDLERERARSEEERRRADVERERALLAEASSQELRRELEEERARAARGFWRRLFGG